MLTDMGLCHTLNGDSMGEIFKRSKYIQSLEKNLIGSDFHGNLSASERDGGPLKMKGSGPMFKTRIVLDAQTRATNPG